MKKLKISIRKRKENPIKGADYEIKVNDLVLGRGVSNVKIDMPAGKRPKVTIEAFPDEIIFDELLTEIKIVPLGQYGNVPTDD